MATKQEGTKPDLRSLPKREKLTENEFKQLVVHVSRHCGTRDFAWISELTWCSETLVLEAYKARP